MSHRRVHFAFLNVGHFLDHFFMLIFATVAALRLADEWGMTYAALIPYATPGFIAFGVGAIPAGWLADKWSREGMMVIFFLGIGAGSIATALAGSPVEIAIGLLVIGLFAAIYHPVGLAMVVHGRENTGVPLAINGIFGNLGVASAALFAGYLIDTGGWRNAFVLPGAAAVGIGLVYAGFVWSGRARRRAEDGPPAAKRTAASPLSIGRETFLRVLAIIVFTTALGGIVFQSTTFALPEIFDERLGGLADSATAVGAYAFVVFAVAAFAQLAVGYLVDRGSVRTVFAFVTGLQAVFFAAMAPLTGVAALVVAVAFMLVVFGQIPINDVLVGRITRSEWRSRVYAVRYIVTFSVTAATLPLIAWIHAGWGFDVLFVVMAVVGACMFAATLLLPRRGAVIGRSPALS